MAITGTRVDPEANGPSCVTVTTDSEGHRISRQGSDVGAIELRTHVFIDALQPQLAAYMGTKPPSGAAGKVLEEVLAE